MKVTLGGFVALFGTIALLSVINNHRAPKIPAQVQAQVTATPALTSEDPNSYIHIHKAATPVPTPTPDAAQVARDKAIHRWGGDEKLRVLDVT